VTEEPEGLIDVTALSITELAEVDPDSPLGRVLARLLENIEAEGVLSAFSSFVK
jgi:hypothetical protein